MANSSQLVSWILTNAEALNLEIETLEWINNIFPDLTDVSVHITCGGKRHSGLGFGGSPDLALIKAFAEAAERAVASENRLPNSSGGAAHTDPKLAEDSAIRELLERDAILCHFYTRTPFKQLASADQNYPRLSDAYKSWNVQFKTYELCESGLLFVAFGQNAIRNPFGLVMGAAWKANPIETFCSAAIECTRQVAHIVQSELPVPAINLQDFLKLKSWEFTDHGNLALNLDYFETIRILFESKSEVRSEARTHNDISVAALTAIPEALRTCPLEFAYANSDSVQKLFLGPPTAKAMNLERLSDFSKTQMGFEHLFELPHPFN